MMCASNAFVSEENKFKWCLCCGAEQVTEEADVLM